MRESVTGTAFARLALAVGESPTAPSRASQFDPADRAGEDGLSRLLANLEGVVPPPPAWFTIGYRLRAVARGSVVLEFQPLPAHTNYGGTVHGGILSALADSSMGCAVLTTLAPEEWCATSDISMRFFKSARVPGRPVIAHGTVKWRGASLAVAESQLCVDDVVIGWASSTCVIRRGRRLPGQPSDVTDG